MTQRLDDSYVEAKRKNIDEDGRRALFLNKERNCPICGLKMKWLSFQLWQCKCGHTEKGEQDAKEKGEEKHERRRKWGARKRDALGNRNNHPIKG